MSTLAAAFDAFRHTAFRYEGLPAYLVDDEVERIAAWREHRPRPERSVRTSEWLRRIAVTTAQGKEWARVRAVDWPLPEYLRYELAGYVENQAAGDRTLLIDRARAGDLGSDFWLFDAGTPQVCAWLQRYDPEGRWLGADPVTDPATLDLLVHVRARLLREATPLNEWLAAQETRVA